MLNSFHLRNNSEIEAKFIQDRIQFVERNLGEFCNTFAQYCRKTARLRDKGDELAKIVLNYAESENINKSLAMGLESFAEHLSTISDYGDSRVQMLEAKIISEFARYEDICKHAKDEVKDIYTAREREINRKRQLDRIKDRNPRNRQQIVQAETELVKATAEVSKTIHSLEEKTNNFERQKLHDIKSILLDFITIELGYHAKVIEIFTKAFNDINHINEESDLKEFKKSLRMPDTNPQKSPARKSSLFRSTGSLGSIGGIFSTTQRNKNVAGIPHLSERSHFKSEETLDSMKHSISDSNGSESQEEENDTSSNINNSSIVRKKLSN
ncbi:protein FAM92A isoform X2 [Anoplophora glabripennis]|uniref:protein FAM92A isoform X2 n=1 Tax=Anoplophora glabripennis TaxID=217634 RepID=UPI0008736681|nr:protein FAM92A isoform X2 [Anoplophora glabripennis]